MKWIVALFLLGLPAEGAVGVRLILGLGDREQVKWDGSATARGSEIKQVEPWRFDDGDTIAANAWRVSTHPIRLFGGQNQDNAPIAANGVILTLDETSDAEVAVTTAQGNFTFRLQDIPYGKSIKALNGRVMVDRIPAAVQLTSSREEQDYPVAATDKDNNVWIAYLEFKHHADHNRLRANMQAPIAEFSKLKEPPGGDQVFLRKLSGGDVIEVTPPGGDLYRPAVAIDGSARVWVFWSQNDRGNFDLWARPVAAGKAGAVVRITREPGSDVFPAAATDASGRVWVAWQGWRDGKAAIFAVRQNGDSFTAPTSVSSSNANEWNPAIAADGNGRVTVAWDSYRNGNYDIYMRTSTNGTWGAESMVVATARYEAYPSIAYDPAGRLWVAYEEGGERWGKDFGAYDTKGLALYQGRAVRLVGFDRDGSAIGTRTAPGTVMPGIPAQRVDAPDRQNDRDDWLKPNPNIARDRANAAAARNVAAPKNTSPRLQVDSSGRIWIAFRSAHPIWWNPLGTVWSEHVVSYDGSAWTGPIFLAHTDNVLDNRPALVSTKAGELTVIGSADGRRQFHTLPLAPNAAVDDPFNNDLWANTIALGPALSAFAIAPASKSGVAGPDTPDQAEKAAIARLREYRANSLRIVRGEFHRHSEISPDGGNDGTILDQWRYILDTGALDWVGCCDHDNGMGREYTWWTTQKLTDLFHTPGKFVPMFSYERSVAYPEGHRNVILAQRGVRTLPRLLPRSTEEPRVSSPDTQMLYQYLKFFDGIAASHTSGTSMGTDWRDNDPLSEPVVEIYQGDRQNYEMPDAPRANSEKDSIGGWRPKGFVDLALEMGYKLAFEASSDHVSTHMSYGNLFVSEPTRAAVLDAFKKRHVYAATDNILADVRSGPHMMGDAFSSPTRPLLQVKLEGTDGFAKVVIVKDGAYVYASEPRSAKVDFTWRDETAQTGRTSYYYVRGEQTNGEVVWASPMWITYTGK
jgi:hypothetical protein